MKSLRKKIIERLAGMSGTEIKRGVYVRKVDQNYVYLTEYLSRGYPYKVSVEDFARWYMPELLKDRSHGSE